MNISLLFSLEQIETEQIISDDRDYSLSYYENETAISHWYGSETWAVKFVAEEFLISSSITISAVNIYFPTVPTGSVNIRGFSYTDDSQYDPLFGEQVPELSVLNHTITEAGWHQFPLSDPYTSEGLWVIVDNETNFSSNFMASASGGGENSYYKVTDGNSTFFNSLYSLGIEQEFLFSIEGYLETENDTDRVIIKDVSLEYSHEDLWEYNYKIRNISAELIPSALLEIEIQHPDPEIYDTTYTYLNLDLTPQSDITSQSDEPLYLQLPILDSQYKITSSIKRNAESNSLSTKIVRICNFQEESDTAIIQNFVSGNYEVTQALLNTQRNIAQDNWLILNYGVDGSDQAFYSNYAYDYYQNIGVNLMPLTVINGLKYFNSYYPNALEENLENNVYYLPKVFDITEEGSEEEGSNIIYYGSFNFGNRFVFPEFIADMEMDVFITQKTRHYAQAGDEFIVSEINDVDYDFSRLNEDGDAYFEFAYDSDNVDSLFTATNGEKFVNVFIYREDSNEIISYFRYSLINDILVSNQEDENNQVVEVQDISVYPNPVSPGQKLNILSATKNKYDYYTLYNIRGQKVGKYLNHDDSIKLKRNITSGVYFLRASQSEDKQGPLVKLLIIKE